MLVSEVRIVTLSAGSLDNALALYSGVLGLEVIARAEVPHELSDPWRIPSGVGGEMALLAAGGERTGMLWLVEFDAPGRRIWTKADQLSGNGFWALNFRVHDIRELLPRLMETGATGTGEAKNWLGKSARSRPSPCAFTTWRRPDCSMKVSVSRFYGKERSPASKTCWRSRLG